MRKGGKLIHPLLQRSMAEGDETGLFAWIFALEQGEFIHLYKGLVAIGHFQYRGHHCDISQDDFQSRLHLSKLVIALQNMLL
jgi:hypothetical protein